MNSFQKKLRLIPYYGVLGLLVYMPFHVFLSQWFSSFTGGLELWKGAKDLITFLLLLVSIALVSVCVKTATKAYWYLVGAGAVYGALHVITYLVNKDTSLQVAGLATAYNCRLFAFAIIGWSAALLTPELLKPRRLAKVIIVISTVVCFVGLLQYMLPKDVMTHFGYSLERGVKPAFFIDDKPDLPRIMSTLRDPNSLAAFLVMPITLIWSYMLTNKNKDRLMLLGGLLGVHGLALFLTFSRGGWAGAFISLVVVTVYLKRTALMGWLRRYNLAIAAGVIVLAFGAFALRDQYFVQHVIFHSDENTVAEMDSNDLHVSFAKQGLEGIANDPFGHGPGTAGIVSIQKPDGGLLTENYFIQIGYEVGIVGLVLFLAAWIGLLRYLVKTNASSLTASALYAAGFGFMLTAMISHVWTNEAVAMLWWLSVGVAVGLKIASHPRYKR